MNLQQEFVGTLHRIIDRDNPETLKNTIFVPLEIPAMMKYNGKIYIAFSDRLSHELVYIDPMPVYEVTLVPNPRRDPNVY